MKQIVEFKGNGYSDFYEFDGKTNEKVFIKTVKRMDKHYIPELEEFYVGFEYECLFHFNDWRSHTYGSEEEVEVYGTKELDYLKRHIKNFRVKYLDREDIESLGFKIDADYKSINSVIFSKDDYTILQSDITEILISDSFNETTLFNGRIKNKSELKKLLKQLGI